METKSSTRQAVADLLSKVNDIAPAIATHPGLQREEATLVDIKRNLHDLDAGLQRKEDAAAKQREISRHHAEHARKNLQGVCNMLHDLSRPQLSDKEFAYLSLAAEHFVAMCREYFSYKHAAGVSYE